LKIFIKVLLILSILFIMQCGEEEKDKTKIKPNTPPEISEVTIMPLHPTTQSEITVHILGSDNEGDPIKYNVKWFINGEEIGEGMFFKYKEIKPGDRIYAEITPSDGKDSGKPVKTDEIIIGGIAPRILSIKTEPEILFVTTPQVAVTAMVEDPDRDSINLILHWVINDRAIPDTSNVLDLTKFKLKKNDIITAAAFADDGENRSEAYGFELVIANSPPRFSTKLDSIKCKTDSIYYSLPIIDPDRDPITFELLKAPQGIAIDKNKGIIHGLIPDTMGFKVMVRATDAEGDFLEAEFTIAPP
jgi:hypothetical protein